MYSLVVVTQVHKVIPGTLADRDGRIQKGDRVLSINGRSTKGVAHREALSILKVLVCNLYSAQGRGERTVFPFQAPRAEVVLVLSRSRSVTPAELGGAYDHRSASSSDFSPYSYVNVSSGRPPKILESPMDSKSLLSGSTYNLRCVDAS